jgi:hypothetical protein
MRALALGLILSVFLGGDGRTQSSVPRETESLAAWAGIASVLTHPRCLNCHQPDTPLQGDARRVHIPPVVRGPDDMGAGAMRCHNCHGERSNNRFSGVPGAPGWRLAPPSMLWEGLSSARLCRLIRDWARDQVQLADDPCARAKGLTGEKAAMLERLVWHMNTCLVTWGWDPGGRRSAVPMPHDDFIEQVKIWVAGGAACPP